MKTENTPVPEALRIWFIVHFAVDMIFAIPLFIAPTAFLTWLGWKTVDPVAARIVSSALLGIGIESLLSRNAGAESFRTMLSMKIIWSSAASVSLATGLFYGSFKEKAVGPALLGTFLLFNALWVYWYIKLRNFSPPPSKEATEKNRQ